MQLSIIGYPRIGKNRELKKITEDYLNNKVQQKEFVDETKKIMKTQWEVLKQNNIDYIPSNDFSYYDMMLDTALLLNVIPQRYIDLQLNEFDTYFAMAKGYQDESKDVKALEMKKWFNTNYHYIVPKIDNDTKIKLTGSKIFNDVLFALNSGIQSKPVIIGPLTFLKLSKIKSDKSIDYFLPDIINAYLNIIAKLNSINAEYLQIDEPVLVTDLTEDDKKMFLKIYSDILSNKQNLKIILQTYFGDVRDIYNEIMQSDFDAVGFDFIEGKYNLELIQKYGFNKNKKLFAGIVNGKNIWKNNYKNSLDIINKLSKFIQKDRIALNTSCSLLHVPYSLDAEVNIKKEYLEQMSFAEEKLAELNELKELFYDKNYLNNNKYINNQNILNNKSKLNEMISGDIAEKIKNFDEHDFYRKNNFTERNKRQSQELNLPYLPTTTIGSFPQTNEIRKLRSDLKKGIITESDYENKIKEKIKRIIDIQNEIGIDVLVHGEYERTDMVEYFGENLKGFLFTSNGWVQSYGTRGVKPPIIFGDVKRIKPISIDWIKYAQSLTDKPVKGMLTGPVTILNWSFAREDLSLKEITYQIALAVKTEVMDLEANGIKIIQIDEPALREKLPLRRESRHKDYLDWAVKAFRITCSDVDNKTQIHTHMCYSEFKDILNEIKDLDADVITIESAKSDLSMLGILKKYNYPNQVGPGVYDIHSSRIPSINEIEEVINKMTAILDVKTLWINPDCGLKTRNEKEAFESLKNMVIAAKNIRKNLS